MNSITVKIGTVYQSVEKGGMFELYTKNKDEDSFDIFKKLSSEILSERDVDVDGDIDIKEMKKLIPPKVILKNFYYGNRIDMVKWLDIGYKSNVGKVRSIDEDSIVVITTEISDRKKSNCSLFVLGDGVGGHSKGEVASYMGTKIVAEELLHLMLTISEKTENEIESSITYSIKEANKAISDHIKIHPEYGGMATTIVVALLNGEQLYIGNVGDSRAYIIGNEIRQITKDHSIVQEMVEADRITKEEARTHPQKKIVTRTVGYYQDIDVDIFKEKIYKEDVLILCCDGLTDVVRDDDIKDIVSKNNNCSNVCNDLINIANEKGGPDNISVIASRRLNLDLDTQLKQPRIDLWIKNKTRSIIKELGLINKKIKIKR